MWTDIAVLLLGIVCFCAPLGLVVWGARRVLRWRERTAVGLSERGSVHTWHVPLMLGLLIAGCGATLSGVAILPLAVWIFDRDAEAGRVALALLSVFPILVVPGLLTALPGLRFWVVEPTQLVARRFGRERQIALDSIVELRRPRLSVSGAVVAVGADSTMRVPGQVDRFDELLDRLSLATDATPPRPANWDRHSAPQQAHPAPPTANDTSWQLSALRTKVVLGFLVALLAFFWTWPWFLVGGDSPTRDSILFMGIGTLLWAAVALLVAQESFQRGQPVELSLTASGLTYRTFRRAPIQVAHHELLLATVEPDIIYVRGIPGQRYPLVLTLEGGTRVRIDDMRARHLGSSTHALASAIRRHTFDPTKRSVAQRQEGEDLAADDDPLTLLRSFALDPQPDRSSLTRRAGDGFRNTGNHELAIAAYQFHLDTNPDDSASHQGLIAAYRSAGRDDLASEAAEAAERLLLG